MAKNISHRFDLIAASIDHLIAVSFPKTSSPIYPLAVNVAQSAVFYDEILLGNKIVHLVAFSRTRDDAGRACALIRYISGWKGVQFFIGGKITQNFWNITRVLECFLEATKCVDWTAHCHTVIDDLYFEGPKYSGLSFTLKISDAPSIKESIKIDRYLFPCKFLHGYFKFQTDHPAKVQDQIQAQAVSYGCDWCPHFDTSHYRKIGQRVIYKNAFS